MPNDAQSIKAFMNQAQQRAETILSAEHIGGDVKMLIRDLLQISKNLENLMHESSGNQSDMRVLKKRLDQAKAIGREDETKIAAVRTIFFSLADEIKLILSEAAKIIKHHEARPNESDAGSAARIKASAQKMIEIIVKSS
jgi:regulator of replication initiation timing